MKVRGGDGLDGRAPTPRRGDHRPSSRPPACAAAAAPGFPTGRKWRTVRDYCSNFERTSVVVNAAEGEPGTFKDRTILRNDPYQVLEGALIAALRSRRRSDHRRARSDPSRRDRAAAGRDRRDQGRGLVGRHRDLRLRRAGRVSLRRRDGPVGDRSTAAIPLPRIAPPYRRGVREVVESAADVGTRQRLVGARRDGRTERRQRSPARVGRQRRDARERRAHPRPRCGMVPDRRHAGVAGHDRLHRDGLDRSQRRRRSHHGHAVARGDRRDRWRPPSRPSDPRPCCPECRARSSRAPGSMLP